MNELKIIEHKNQRVLLTNQLAESYGTTNQVITNNFNRNKGRYEQGKHYFTLEGDCKKEFVNLNQIELGSLKNAKTIYLWTERGAFLHAKSLNTDKAWEVYDSLVEHYFKSQENKPYQLPTTYKEALLQLVAQVEENERLNETIEIQKPLVDFADHVSNTTDLIDMGNMAKLLKDEHIDIGRNRLFEYLRKNKILMHNNLPYQRFIDDGYFRVKELTYTTSYGDKVQNKTYVTGKGQIYLTEKLRKEFCTRGN